MKDKGEDNLEEGLKFLAENKKKEGVIELPSGLQYKVLNEGDGEIPNATDQVKCHYHGTLIDGTVFDSSVQRGQPAVFPVNGVIQGWVEALQLCRLVRNGDYLFLRNWHMAATVQEVQLGQIQHLFSM